MFNKTQQAVLRHIFGSDDSDSERQVGIICRPHAMPIVRGSREWKVCVELAKIGVVVLKQVPQGWWVASRAVAPESHPLLNPATPLSGT